MTAKIDWKPKSHWKKTGTVMKNADFKFDQTWLILQVIKIMYDQSQNTIYDSMKSGNLWFINW
jgi:hypothetical protein